MDVPRKPHGRLAAQLGVLMLSLGCSAEPNSDAGNAGAAGKSAALPRISIVEPEEGASLNGSSVLIVLSAENIALAPAGDTTPGTGHHHLFINAPILPAVGEPIPAGITGIVHLGKAQTSYELTNLAPGEYTVISVIGDLAHRRLEQVADTVRFRVN
jgi:hypothetical protein